MPGSPLDVAYDIHGDFIETCDCYVVCPCWVDDDPDEGHCTGLLAWTLAESSAIDGVPVHGRTVVSVSTHAGNRRRGGTATALFVDEQATADQFAVLTSAFAGRLGGPLADLASVSGTVMQEKKATIVVSQTRASWRVEVRLGPLAGGTIPPTDLVDVSGSPRIFDGGPRPFTLAHTALSTELGVSAAAADAVVTAQRGDRLGIHVAVLPGGYVDVTGRSGMRGAFAYRYAGSRDAGAGNDEVGE